MPALNFQRRFAPAIKAGTKRQTIRALRKHPVKVGDTLYLYTGMRHPSCEKIGTTICSEIAFIRLENRNGLKLISHGQFWLDIEETLALARSDGFANLEEMFAWFEETHGLPFIGALIKWGELL